MKTYVTLGPWRALGNSWEHISVMKEPGRIEGRHALQGGPPPRLRTTGEFAVVNFGLAIVLAGEGVHLPCQHL